MRGGTNNTAGGVDGSDEDEEEEDTRVSVGG